MSNEWYYNPQTGEARLYGDVETPAAGWVRASSGPSLLGAAPGADLLIVPTSNSTAIPTFRVEREVVIWAPYLVLLLAAFGLLLYFGGSHE